MAAGVPLPVDALDVGGLGLIPARRRVEEGVVDPALAEPARDTVLFLVVVVAIGIDQQSQRGPFPVSSGGKDEKPGSIAVGRDLGDEDIGRAALPSFVLVEGPAGLLEAHLLDELIGALSQGLGVLRRPDGAGHDRAVRASILGGQSRRDKGQDQGNQNEKRMEFGHGNSLTEHGRKHRLSESCNMLL